MKAGIPKTDKIEREGQKLCLKLRIRFGETEKKGIIPTLQLT